MIDWLGDGMGLIADASATEGMALSVPDAAGVKVLPALTGLGAPWWRPEASGRRGWTDRQPPDRRTSCAPRWMASRSVVADVVESMTARSA